MNDRLSAWVCEWMNDWMNDWQTVSESRFVPKFSSKLFDLCLWMLVNCQGAPPPAAPSQPFCQRLCHCLCHSGPVAALGQLTNDEKCKITCPLSRFKSRCEYKQSANEWVSEYTHWVQSQASRQWAQLLGMHSQIYSWIHSWIAEYTHEYTHE